MLVSKRTEVSSSDIQFPVSSVNLVEGDSFEKVVKLCDVKNLVTFQRATCEVKVVNIDDVEEVAGGKKKQDVLIGDVSGAVRLTLWEGDIGKVEEGMCYKLSGVVVREFKGKKFLSTAKNNCNIIKISDIGCVEEGEDCDNETTLFDHLQPAKHVTLLIVGYKLCYIHFGGV